MGEVQERMRRPHVAKARQYMEGILSGEIPACKWVRLACERQRCDLERAAEGWVYLFDEEAAERVCEFIESFPHVKGRWAIAQKGAGSNLIRLEPWQCFVLCTLYGWLHATPNEEGRRLRRFRLAYIAIPRKNGKALALDTPVPTPGGWTTQGALKPGDTVFDERGEPCRVVAVSETWEGRPCFEMEFSDGVQIVADAEHEWWTDARRTGYPAARRREATDHIRTTQEIAASLKVDSPYNVEHGRVEWNHSVPIAGALQTPHAPLPLPPYALGVWLGDGTSGSAAVTCAPADVELAEHLQASGVIVRVRSHSNALSLHLGLPGDGGCGRGHPASDRSTSSRRTCLACKREQRRRRKAGGRSPRVDVPTFQSGLRDLGVLGNKHIPTAYLRASVAQRMDLLRGLMDTDGTISKAGQCSFTTTSAVLREGFMELARSLGFKPSLSTRRALLKGKDCGPMYTVQFWAFNDRPVFCLARKRARQKPAPECAARSARRQIVRVESVPSVPVRCIQVNSPSRLYLAGEGMVPTHNSSLMAPLGLYHVAADGEPGAEVFCGATSKDQAFEVFRPARQMATSDANGGFCAGLGVEVAAESIFRPGDGSFFKPLIGKPGDGASPSCYICDEYHEHPDDTQLDTMRTGMGAREQPLAIVITTAGEDVASPCHLLQQDVQKILEGTITDGAAEETFGIIYTIDEDDDWTSDEALRKANPNYGVSVLPAQLHSLRDEALRSPRKQNVFKTKRLNLWVHARDPWMNMERWNQSAGAPPEEEFAGARCWMAMDLSSKIDLTAVVRLYRREVDGERHYYAYASHFLPESRAQMPEHQHYQGWVLDGHLRATDGDAIDYEAIREEVLERAACVELACLAYDPWNAMATAQSFQAEGLPVVEVPQNVRHLSEAMKEIESLVLAGRFHHTGDPVLTWAVSNVTAKEDAKGNLFPRKESRESKIDPAVALITAMSRAMVDTAGPKVSVYESRGVRAV